MASLNEISIIRKLYFPGFLSFIFTFTLELLPELLNWPGIDYFSKDVS